MNKRQKRGLAAVLIGLVLLLSGLFVHWLQQREDITAGNTSAVLLEQLDDETAAIAPGEKDIALPEKTYKGYTLIGDIEVASAGIRLPVLSDWNNQMLKAAPCRYQGSLTGGDMIIMAHNYQHHFRFLQTVKIGTGVTFTNTAGVEYRYRVAKVERLHRSEGEKLPSADYPLTLFTCTPGGIERVVVRCEKETE